MIRRKSGILLHVTSLPGSYGIGDLGPEAYAFVAFLHDAGQRVWQVLPLIPTAHGHSPYSSISTFAGNPAVISPEKMLEDGLIEESDTHSLIRLEEGQVFYRQALDMKRGLLDVAYKRFRRDGGAFEYDRFRRGNADWLDDFALFTVLRDRFNQAPWTEWPDEFRRRVPEALQNATEEHREAIERKKFEQFVFHAQWWELKKYANRRGIQIIGDLPIYANFDSADVWSDPGLFKLDEDFNPMLVAGVPPDYFSETGQLWGNPVYNWDRMRERGFKWWIKRMEHQLTLYDLVRIDHFRGFVAGWEVPAGETTAINGKWVEAPATEIFREFDGHFPHLPVIVEDLGTITADVREVVRNFGLPGMKVLMFAFGDDNPLHPYKPHNYEPNCVVYTGTHDTNTAKGWFEHETNGEILHRLNQYLGKRTSPDEVSWDLIRLAMGSVAKLVIVPAQELLNLGADSRMNTPGTIDGNWRWRLRPGQLDAALAERLRTVTATYGRV